MIYALASAKPSPLLISSCLGCANVTPASGGVVPAADVARSWRRLEVWWWVGYVLMVYSIAHEAGSGVEGAQMLAHVASSS